MFRFLRTSFAAIGLLVVLTASGAWDPPDVVLDAVVGALDDDGEQPAVARTADVVPAR
jgi:hypothetical protein